MDLPVNKIVFGLTTYTLQKVNDNRAIVKNWNDCPFAMRADKKNSKKIRFACVWKGGTCKTFKPCEDNKQFPEDCPLNNEITICR